jgi:CheY-like chemotaxis protein
MSLILVIEDDRVQRLACAHALKHGGHEVLEAVDGVQGLQMARTQKPDLIVCDVLMPGMNGYQIVTALREEPGIADIPVIMLTAMTERAHMRLAMTSGADDYIAKPFTSQELNEAANSLIARRKTQVEGLVNLIKSEIVDVMDEQKQELAAHYERRFIEELNSRWERGEDADTELRYERATVLVADLFGSVLNRLPQGSRTGEIARRVYQGARDTLYLFGASHLVGYGNDLLAVFTDAAGATGTRAEVRAGRAGFALSRAVGVALKAAFPAGLQQDAPHTDVTVALHVGAVTLLRVSDPLHGDPDTTLAAGETLDDLRSLREFGRAQGWRIIASRALVEGVADQVQTGRSGVLQAAGQRPALEAVELLEAR